MEKKQIINQFHSMADAGQKLTNAEYFFCNQLEVTVTSYPGIPDDAIVCNTHIDDAKGFVELMKKYGFKSLVNTSGWSGELERSYWLQEEGLKIERLIQIAATRRSIEYGLLMTLA